jgi:hypothetical protein
MSTTKEQLSRMSLPEKVSQHAKDIMETENNPKFLKMNFQIVGGIRDGQYQTRYPDEEGKYVYDFLFGGGSLGHPFKPTIIGEAVYTVAMLVDTQVSFLDFTFARFGKRINQAVIKKAFYPIWEMSEKLKALPQPVAQSAIEQHIEQARIALYRV